MKHIIFAVTLILLTGVPMHAAAESHPLYEMRTYYANEGKIEDLHARFRDHTLTLTEKHGMKTFWSPADQPNALIYIVAHKSAEAAEASWKAFSADPVWARIYAASIADGQLVAKIDNVFMTKTDYSP